MNMVTRANKLLIQLDLQGHSDCIRETEHKLEAVNAKNRFAKSVTKMMKAHNFREVFWAGDGGMYARDVHGLPHYDCAITAAERLADTFRRWTVANKVWRETA